MINKYVTLTNKIKLHKVKLSTKNGESDHKAKHVLAWPYNGEGKRGLCYLKGTYLAKLTV